MWVLVLLLSIIVLCICVCVCVFLQAQFSSSPLYYLLYKVTWATSETLRIKSN